MTAKEIFESIDLSQLPKEAADKFRKVEKATKGFSIESEKVNTFMRGAYKKIKETKPTALKNLKVEEKIIKKEVKNGKTTEVVENLEYKVEGTKKVSKKTPTPSKPKRKGETAMERARKIRRKDEAWKDALARAQRELKAEAAKAKKDAEKVVSTTSQALKSLEKMIQNDPKLKGYPRTYGNQSKRIDANKDAKIKAKPAGKRVSKKGHKNQYGESKGGRVYWENRDNRSDRYAPNFPNKVFLEMGGETDDLGFPTGHTFLVVEVSPDGTKNLIKSTTDYMTALMSSAVTRGRKTNKNNRVVIVDKEDKKVIHEAFEAGGEITITPTQIVNNPDYLVGTTTMTELFEAGGVTAYQEGGEELEKLSFDKWTNLVADEIVRLVRSNKFNDLVFGKRKDFGLDDATYYINAYPHYDGILELYSNRVVPEDVAVLLMEKYRDRSEVINDADIEMLVEMKRKSKNNFEAGGEVFVTPSPLINAGSADYVAGSNTMSNMFAKGGKLDNDGYVTPESLINSYRRMNMSDEEILDYAKYFVEIQKTQSEESDNPEMKKLEMRKAKPYEGVVEILSAKTMAKGGKVSGGKRTFDVHFQKVIHERVVYKEKISGRNFANIKSKAIKIAKEKGYEIASFYITVSDRYRDDEPSVKRTAYIGYVDKDDDWAFTAGHGYHHSPFNTKNVKKVEEMYDFAKGGFIAIYNGKRVEIEAETLLDAKKKAIQELKVPKSKQGLLSVMSNASMANEDFRFMESGGKLPKNIKYYGVNEVKEYRLKNGDKIDPSKTFVDSGVYVSATKTMKPKEKEFQQKLEFKKGGATNWKGEKINWKEDYIYIPRFEIEEVELDNGKVIKGDYVVSGLYLPKSDRTKQLEKEMKARMKKMETGGTIVAADPSAAMEDLNQTYGYESVYEKGGRIGFEGLAKKVAKRYEGKAVKSKYQEEYGKTYSKEEAMEVGRKVAAKVYGQQQAKMEMGGQITQPYSLINAGSADYVAGSNTMSNMFAKGGSLDGHGLQLGDKIVKDLGSILQVATKDGGMVYVDLASGYRGKDMPLPFAKGGAVGGMKIPDIAKKFGKTTSDVFAQLQVGEKHEMEHTNDPKKARKIALDHLSGDLDYYTKLNKLGL